MKYLNWFKKEQKEGGQKQVIVKDGPPKKKYSAEIEKIHNEFFSSADELLKEANYIINEVSKKAPLIEKGKKLMSLGFNQARQSEEAKVLAGKLETSIEQKELAVYYAEKYPLKTIFKDGKLIVNEKLTEIRKRLVKT